MPRASRRAGGSSIKKDFVTASAAVLAVVFATMFYASARIGKENIVDALRIETM